MPIMLLVRHAKRVRHAPYVERAKHVNYVDPDEHAKRDIHVNQV